MSNRYYFSANSVAVYDYKMKSAYDKTNTWPSDGIVISDEDYKAFFSEPVRHQGKELGALDGLPAWVDIPLPDKDEVIATEIQWRDAELNKALNRVDQYEKDQGYAVELRTSPFTVEQYNRLLQDRKLLCDYSAVDGFPFVERPVLSGLV